MRRGARVGARRDIYFRRGLYLPGPKFFDRIGFVVAKNALVPLDCGLYFRGRIFFTIFFGSLKWRIETFFTQT